MNLKRIIPVLLLKDDELYKTIKFDKPQYVGDPINAVKIFNEKEVDELIILDIEATNSKKEPNYQLLQEIASESFIPLAYGGGVNNIDTFKKIVQIGFERICINSGALDDGFIKEAVKRFGSSAVVVSIDYKMIDNKPIVYTHSGRKSTEMDLYSFSLKMEELGVGELLINNINLDGTYLGYDLELVKTIVQKLSTPLIICGGASSLMDVENALKSNVSAAAGSLFVFYGKLRAVLINYPNRDERDYINELN